MPRDPHMVSIPVALLDDRRLGPRDRDTLMHLIAWADNSTRCDDEQFARLQLADDPDMFLEVRPN
jgi:hypothetical protein